MVALEAKFAIEKIKNSNEKFDAIRFRVLER
jgi:hypothetical protein